MTISQILIVALAAFLLGWLTRKGARVQWLMAASILAVFWLQPVLSLRYLDFLLPALSIGITMLTWALTASDDARAARENWRTGGFILGLILLLGATRYLGLDGFLLPSRPPALKLVLPLIAATGFALLLLLSQKQFPGWLLWGGFGSLLALFLVLKTPAMALQVSRLWRRLVGQQVELAATADLSWLGYSYLAFRLLHTIRDRQSGRLPDVSLAEYVTYVIFFPAFPLGPIERIERFVKGLRANRNAFADDLLNGGQRLTVGLFKKFVVADTLAMIALNPVSAGQVRSPLGAWILLYAYAFQIYFDFSGYVDIAIGLGQWMGITLPENFRQPYRQPNLTLFWNNWHITLTQWFRAYFFNPVARAMRSSRKISPGMMILLSQVATMVLIGLWHGVLWHFVFWGAWHGMGLFVQNRWSAWRKAKIAGAGLNPRAARWLSLGGILLTFHFVAFGWIWFVLPDPALGWQFILKLAGVA